MKITDLLELNNIAQDSAKIYSHHRILFDSISKEKGKHFTGIAGHRGVGKTILLKQLAISKKNSFYISVDTLEENNLFFLIKELNDKYGFNYFLLDEIHFYENFEKELKKIYDFLDVKIIFSSSVSIAIFESSYDLSRRVLITPMYPFTFLEYLMITQNINLSPLSVTDILNKKWSTEHMQSEIHFDNYLKGGIMPFAIDEPEPLLLLENILKKIIKKDIPTSHPLKMSDLDELEKTIKFIGLAEVEGINYSSISKNIGITKYKAELYLKILENAFVLNMLFPAGTNVLKEPKILLSLPYRLLFKSFEESIGGIREDFFVNTAKMRGFSIKYLKSKRGEKIPDFILSENNDNEIIIEIGGKNKGREQFKGLNKQKSLILSHPSKIEGIKRPLFLFGMC